MIMNHLVMIMKRCVCVCAIFRVPRIIVLAYFIIVRIFSKIIQTQAREVLYTIGIKTESFHCTAFVVL